jgi:hypothetical protein
MKVKLSQQILGLFKDIDQSGDVTLPDFSISEGRLMSDNPHG